jgi:leucyl aminopeptidase
VITVRLGATDPATVKADALVIGVAHTPDGPTLAPGAESVNVAFDGHLIQTLSAMGVTGHQNEVVRIPTGGAISAPVLVTTGLGTAPEADEPYDHERVRRAAGAAMRALDGVESVATTLAMVGGAAIPSTVAAVSEGLLLGGYRFRRYRTSDPPRGPERATVLTATTGTKELQRAVRHAEIVTAAVGLNRDLVNTAPSDLPPEGLATAAREVATETGLAIEVLNEKALRKGGYGGLLGVGAGSANPPRLIRLAYEHSRAKQTIAFVGKGITFDSGGLSLKPAQAMEWMKSDMSGAAAVIATMQAVAALKPRVNVIGYAPTAENMPGGTAIRPSDVLTLRGGKTVEVLNTDAEGRLILADAIARASEDEPDVIIDVATLTAAQLIALGSRTGAVMANDDGLRAAILDAADRAGESLWPMPLPPELRPSLDSGIADLQNLGERSGGMLVAGLFLQEFVPAGVRWAHLDIAGPAYNQGDAYGYTPKGGTGAVVRTLVRLVEDIGEGVFS